MAKFNIGNLSFDKLHHFRVRMVNEVGESKPSDQVQEITKLLIPGAPQELRVSSKRTDSSIKICWKEPISNPEAVEKYEVEVQRKNWNVTKTTKKTNYLLLFMICKQMLNIHSEYVL